MPVFLVQPHGQADPLFHRIHIQNLNVHDIPHADGLQGMSDEPVRDPGNVDEAVLMEEHRFVYASTFAPDKFAKYVRIPFDPQAGPGEKVEWQQ